MYDYRKLKETAKELKRPVTDLIALAPQNDPFYTGTPRDEALGRWFYDLWCQFGYTKGVHIRRMHYQIVSQNPPVKLPNGEPYENTEACWNELTNAAKAARYLEYVDPAAFVDRRNDDPITYVNYWTTREAETSVVVDDRVTFELPELAGLPRYQLDMSSQQRYHLEIWVEKSTMNDVIEPLIRQFQANLVFGKGELSITAALQAVERFQQSDKPIRIFYVSDFDPAGASMPVAMSRKVEYFVNKLDLDLDIKLFPVALTYQQTKYYTRLLPTPIKDSERRKNSFEAKYGGGAVELDALEALYPGELRQVLSRELSRYYDSSLVYRVNDAYRQYNQRLEQEQQAVYDEYQAEIAELQGEWLAIRADFEARIAAHMERRSELYSIIEQDLKDNEPEMDDEEIPEAKGAEERNGALYDSERDYLSQNTVYQNHKRNMSSSA